ncbi:MAG TPA: hypothetical protein PKJ33_02555 [Alphaproteobacteria bacterium]|mgnify:CR=1 FL=1|nr:hypothetical protein [Alphaproteobacteria bacterium]
MFRIENHEILNPKLWNSDLYLKSDVSDALIRICISFMTVLSGYAGISLDYEYDVIDVIISGSSVEYFYDKNSDIDVTIIIRPDRYLKKMRPEIFEEFLNFVKSFFIKKYSPRIYGLYVDISLSAGDNYDFARYSISQRKWLREPTKLTCEEIKEIEKESNKIYISLKNEINDFLKNKRNYDKLTKFASDLRKRRFEAWKGDIKSYLPFSKAYSQINNKGFIKKILETDTNIIKKLILGKKCI